MNISDIYKKITSTIGRITVDGFSLSEDEFKKLIPEEKVQNLSDLMDQHFAIPKIPTNEEEFIEGERYSMLSQDQIRNIPVVVDFVAVPGDFDIDLALSMRESAGMFDGVETNLEHVKFVAETIKASPYMILAKTPDITVQSAFFCLEIFRELGLTVDTNFSEAHDSKFRGRSWKAQAKDWQYEKGHIAQSAFLIVIVNVYRLVEEGIISKITDEIQAVEDGVEKLNENMEMLDKK